MLLLLLRLPPPNHADTKPPLLRPAYLSITHLPSPALALAHSSFMERRGVRTDPLDQTSVVFMDTGEVVPTDLVIVKDAHGEVVPIS